MIPKNGSIVCEKGVYEILIEKSRIRLDGPVHAAILRVPQPDKFLLWHAFAVFEEPASAPAAKFTVQVWPRKKVVSVVTSPRW